MNSKHIIVGLYKDDIIGPNLSDKKNRCISKKKDYLDCVSSNNEKLNNKKNLNNCSQLFWRWYIQCKTYN